MQSEEVLDKSHHKTDNNKYMFICLCKLRVDKNGNMFIFILSNVSTESVTNIAMLLIGRLASQFTGLGWSVLTTDGLGLVCNQVLLRPAWRLVWEIVRPKRVLHLNNDLSTQKIRFVENAAEQ